MALVSEAQSPIAEILASLEGLTLDEFFEESFKQWVLRSPERVTHWGLAAEYGMRNDQLDDLSDAYVRATQELEKGILDLLRTYDRESLTAEQIISYDVYAWWLENQVAGHAFMYHDYTLHHRIGSYHLTLDDLFSEFQPLTTRQDVQDYISRLNQVLRQTEQVKERLAIQEQMGIIPPDFILQQAQTDINTYLGLDGNDISTLQPEGPIMYSRLDASLEEIPELTDEEKQDFRAEALAAVTSSVIPAYELMIAYLDRVLPLTNNDAGAWKLPDGEAYYAHMLRKRSSTSLNGLEIHALGLAEVERCQAQLQTALIEMGYSADATLAELMPQAIEDLGYYDITTAQGQDDYIGEIERAIAEAEQRITEVCDLIPPYPVVVIIGRHGGYYQRGTVNGTRPASFHESLRGQRKHKYSMYHYAYHETTPGHHFQIATAQALDLPTFRRQLIFTGHAEGWASYSEVLAGELGLYENNPGNLGRLQTELVTAAMLVADTGIHALGWTREQARAYMDEALPLSGYASAVDRYVVIPAQAVSYKIGMLMIMELRQQAMEQLGEQFDLKAFHNLIISNGSLPLEILEQVVRDHFQLEGPPIIETWRAQILDFALMTHWALDETGGRIAHDSAGENHAELFGAPVWQPNEGMINGALLLNGEDDFIGSETILDPSEDLFSVFTWIKGGAAGQVVVSQLWGTNWLMADINQGYLQTELREPSHTAQPLVSEVSIIDGNWHHVGVTWDGRHRILYLDGVEVARDTHPNLARSREGLNIGCGPDMTTGTFWSGLIDDVRIYNPAISPKQIELIAQ
jgi:uncharacterized protein (DUF885 family)